MKKNHTEKESREDFEPLSTDPSQSPTLPGFYYHDKEVFEAEKEKIFYKTWQLVAHTSQLPSPGTYVTAKIADQNVFVVRGKDNKIRGFYNVCQHRAHELLKDTGCVKSRIVCPYHSWSYDLSGELKSVRDCNKPCFDMAEYGLTSVRVEEMLGFVFVNLDPSAIALKDVPGNMCEDIKANVPWWDELVISSEADSSRYSGTQLKTNWKVVSEGGMDNYHIDAVHPTYKNMFDVDSYKWDLDRHWSKGYGKMKGHTKEKSEASQMALSWRLWPNTSFFLLPGEHFFTAMTYHAEQPDLTLRKDISLSRPGHELKSEGWDYLWHTLWDEDLPTWEAVQRGLQSRGYRQGRFIINPENPGISEYGPHFFQLSYARAMGIKSD